MNLKQIRELAEIIERTGLTTVDIQEGDSHIVLKREAPAAPMMTAMPQPMMPMPAAVAQPPMDEGVDFNDVTDVTSPMVGVFYAAPSPEDKPFVSVGDKVKKGDVLCIIEAMKLMNEITAEQDGEIVDICARSGDMVEFGQVLFKLY